jgi:hypothetical protein
MDNFVCQSNSLGVKYYFFEFFDEKWKDDLYGGVEGHWGLFYQKFVSRPLHNNRTLTVSLSKTLKSITIPDCPT